MSERYIIPEQDDIEASLQLAGEYGAYFEYNDFFLPAVLDDEEKAEELIAFYKGLSRDRSRDILHGAFLDVTVHSEDVRVREISEYRVRQSLEIGKELGVRGVVFHTNFIPNFRTESYRKHWVESNERFWRKMLAEYADIEILMENMFDEEPFLLAQLAERMQDEPRFGVCLDYAHACVFGDAKRIGTWADALMPYTHHIHINDNDLQVDMHKAVGRGQIDWSEFTKLVKDSGQEPSVLVEVRSVNEQRASLEHMRGNAIYPLHMEIVSKV